MSGEETSGIEKLLNNEKVQAVTDYINQELVERIDRVNVKQMTCSCRSPVSI